MRASDAEISRRRLFELGAAASVPILIAGCGGDGGDGDPTATTAPGAAGADVGLAPTPACDDGDEPTVAQTQGPFFEPDSPERRSLVEEGLAGTALALSGRVLSTACEPIAGALLDFWQADDSGRYDSSVFRLRGHQFTDASGHYRLETIVPGLYSGRTRHIHVKAQPEGGSVLTTQLYFPGEPANESDAIFDERLLIDVRERGKGQRGRFDFVLDA